MSQHNIHIQEIPFGSTQHSASIQLREDVLRKPLGLSFCAEELEAESDSHHFGLWKNPILIATLVLKPIDKDVIKMRQVATHADYQGLGYGTMLNSFCESWCKSNGYQFIVLHARDVATQFYTQLGYYKLGNPFIEVGIPHIKMEKRL